MWALTDWILMTFTILAVFRETGEYGFAQSTSTPAVGELCTAIIPGRGVLTVQAAGDPGLLRLACRLFETGYKPDQAIQALSSDKFIEHRQLALIDLNGRTAVRTGSEAWGWAGEVVGDGHVATANSVVDGGIPEAMSKAYLDSVGEDFAERLMRSVEAGRDAGGQPDGQCSSVIKAWKLGESTLNLRVDVHPEPIGHLRRIFDWYKTLRPLYQRYVVDNTDWDLDSWAALHEAGQKFYPEGGGWTEEDVAKREAEILALRPSE